MPGVGLGAAGGVRNENLNMTQVGSLTPLGGQLSEKRNDLTISFPGISLGAVPDSLCNVG